MSHSSGSEPLSARQRLELESLCDRFETEQTQGMSPRIADYLAGHISPLANTLARELVSLEMEYRRSRGEVPCREDYSALPFLAETDLQELFLRSDNPTKQIGRFNLVHVLGHGAFGTVWKAIDTALGRPVALKLAHANLVDQPQRFLREARAVAQLRHSNIVRVLDVGEWQDQLFIVRELIEGQSLAQRLKTGELPPQHAASWACTLARALSYSHESGCIHRDIKPENVLLDANDEPYLLDFGLAKFTTSQGSSTRHGEMLGTPAYMAPEQARGESRLADARTDVYSLGMVLYQMLAGQLPFRGTVEMIVRQILDEEPPSPDQFRANLPPDLVTICLKCLEKEPSRRYSSASQLGDDLACFLKGKPIQARPVSRLAKMYRWTKRKPTMATLTGLLILLSLGMAIGACIWIYTLKTGWENEKLLRDQATTAAAQAEAEAAHSAEVTTFLETVFAPTDPLSQLLGGSRLSAHGSRQGI